MYLNKAIFKKWIKSAYNSGDLTVGRIYNGLVIKGPFWKVWADERVIPNWVKAEIVEHIGELPEYGEVYKYSKEGNQGVLLTNDLNLPERFLNAKNPFIVTPVVCGEKYGTFRFLQKWQSCDIVTLPEVYYSVIDYSNMESDETQPSGPSAIRSYADSVFWHNEQSTVELCTVKTQNEIVNMVISQCKNIDFAEVTN